MSSPIDNKPSINGLNGSSPPPGDKEYPRYTFQTFVEFGFNLDEPTEAIFNTHPKRRYMIKKLMKMHQDDIVKYMNESFIDYLERKGGYPARLGEYNVCLSTCWDKESEKHEQGEPTFKLERPLGK